MSFTVGLFGDVMLGRRVGRAVRRGSPEQTWTPEVRNLTDTCDLVVANLECCISTRGRRTERILGKRYFFRGGPEGIATLQAIGASAVGLANDHVLDYEEEALGDTLSQLAQADIAGVGAGQDAARARRGVVLTANGYRLGVVAASDRPVAYAALDSAPGIAYLRRGGDAPRWLVEEIVRLKSESDHVVAFLHWRANTPGAPDPWQRMMARELQAAGADLVVGHSARAFHGIGWTETGPVLFDLGPALNDFRTRESRPRDQLGLLALWRPSDTARELEVVGLRLQRCLTGVASGADADRIASHLERTCQELGAEVERVGESRFRILPAPARLQLGIAVPARPKAGGGEGDRPVLWTANDVVELTGGDRLGSDVAWEATDVSYQGVTVRPGHLFAATHTHYIDGHKAAPRAFERGAVAALVSSVPEGLPDGAPLVLVENVMRALDRLARVGRARCTAKTIAVTGSVGKTSTTEALRSVLGAQAVTFACRYNENDAQGALVSLARLPENPEYAIFELALASRLRWMDSVGWKSRRVHPHVAVITAITGVHLRPFYDTVENIADAKAGILEGLREDGVAILPRDAPLFERLARRARRYGVERIVTFGTHPAADVRLDDLNSTGRGSQVFATLHGRELDYAIGRLGPHEAINSLAVLAAAEAVGADVDRAAESFAKLRGAAGRGRRFRIRRPGGAVEVIDHSFSSTSTFLAIEILGAIPVTGEGRRIAVLGDFAGNLPERVYVRLGLTLLAEDVDLVYTTGDGTVGLREVLPAERLGGHAGSSEELARLVVADVRAGDTVLVKGSSKMRMGRVVRALLQSRAPQR